MMRIMHSNWFRRIGAMVLAVLMMMSAMPTWVFAEEGTGSTEPASGTVDIESNIDTVEFRNGVQQQFTVTVKNNTADTITNHKIVVTGVDQCTVAGGSTGEISELVPDGGTYTCTYYAIFTRRVR